MASRKRTLHSPVALRLLSLLLGVTALGIAGLLFYSALRDGKGTPWQTLVIIVFAQSFFEIISAELERFGESGVAAR